MAREHQQVLRVAAHAGGQVVHLEQVGQPLRVLLALLQIIDQPDLAFDQGLAAPGQVHEHRVDVPAQRGLVRGQPECFPVDLVERPSDFTDLVGGVHIDGGDVKGAAAVGLTHPPDHFRQPDPGHFQGARAQPTQRADHRPPDDHGEEQGEREHQQDRRADHDGRGQRRLVQGRRAGADLVVQGLLDRGHLRVDLVRHGAEPVIRAVVDGLQRPTPAGLGGGGVMGFLGAGLEGRRASPSQQS